MDLSSYRNPALLFSGGKDSLACWYLLRGQLDRVTVYWLNTGDTCPETRAVVDYIRARTPRFVEITTDARAWRAANGDPTDLVPASAHAIGLMYGMSGKRLSNRFDCCYANLMLPLHQRVVADGVDAVIRGTKLADTGKLPAEGKTEFYDILLPLRDWTHDDVFSYLSHVGAPRNRVYDFFTSISAPECMGCTAWWGDGKTKYLRELHPQAYHEHKSKLREIKVVVEQHLAELDAELRS